MLFESKRTISDLIEKQAKLDEGKRDLKTQCGSMIVSTRSTGILDLDVCEIGNSGMGAHYISSGERFLVTPHALRQLAQTHSFDARTWERMNGENCPEDVRESYAQHMTTVFGTGFGRKSEHNDRLLRTQKGAIRAVLSEGYGVFNSSRALDLCQKAFDHLDKKGAEVKVWDAFQTADEMCIRVYAPQHGKDDGTSPVYPGVYIGNSEIGTKRLYVKPMVLRQVCSNGMMGMREDGAGMARTHRGSMMILENDFNRALADALNLADEQTEKFLELTQESVTNPLDELATIWRKKASRSEFSKEKLVVAEAFAKEYQRDFGDTKYTVVNALTRLSQTFEDVNDRLAVEQIAGEYALS